ncbi:probable GH family 25 lysozyme 3 [Macrobrachium rosenbergii]|uniref:probable GH family 25 lysozyme 3 n=1 Tax=Macrobrachium rosenbergii TaxID=79674 RepID=UPI0034D78965
MKCQILMVLIGTITTVLAAPQFDFNNNQPTPYSFAYGVSDPDTGDEKEHKETVSPSGVTEGEFRWLQPNGLYRTTRYTADDALGFRAIVSEEPGERVGNYYTNSLLGGSVEVPSVFPSRGNQQSFSGFQSGNQQSFSGFQSGNQPSFSGFQSGNQQSFNNFDVRNQVVTSSQNFQNQAPSRGPTFQTSTISTTQNQGFTSLPVQSFIIPQNPQPQTFTTFTTSQPSQSTGNIIDGGIIDGGFVSGGVIDGGIVGTTSTTFDSGFNQFNPSTSSFNSGSSLNSFGSTSNNFGLNSNRFGTSRLSSRNNNNSNQGLAVLLAGDSNRFRG